MSDDAIVAVALDYFEGWFDGDPARMERALHPELAKRGVVPDGLARTTAARMVELTAEGAGRDKDVGARGIDITVEDVHGEIANVTVRSAVYREYLQLVRTPDGWKIVNALWQAT